MGEIGLHYFIKRIDNIPTLPHIATKLLQTIDDSSSASKDLANVILKDEALTAKILKLVNSAFYGFVRKICSVNHAVVMLGFHNVKNLAMGLSICKSVGGGGTIGSLNTEKFWEHSLACAITANFVAKKSGYPTPEEVFVAGLLHDIGKLIMNQSLPEEYSKAISLVNEEEITLYDAEKKVFETSHTFVGELAAKEWKLPQPLTKVVRYHYKPPGPSSSLLDEELQLVRMVYLSNILCKQKGYRLWDDDPVPKMDYEILKLLNLKENNLQEILNEMEKGVNETKEFFEIQ